jgi:hypothetical protein
MVFNLVAGIIEDSRSRLDNRELSPSVYFPQRPSLNRCICRYRRGMRQATVLGGMECHHYRTAP